MTEIVYGYLIVLGTNGRKSWRYSNNKKETNKLKVVQRSQANGIKQIKIGRFKEAKSSQAVQSKFRHAVSYTLSQDEAIVVEYGNDPETDMYQIGRCTEDQIDFVVNSVPLDKEYKNPKSPGPETVSRFACRIFISRQAPHVARIFEKFNMAMHIPNAPGYLSMMKEGAKFYQGLEESVFRNIQACVALGQTTASTFGPQGMKKMVINHIGKKFVTKDAGTILRELEVEHPAAKLMVMAAQQQEQESGEATNLVIILCASLLEKAEYLLRMGLSVPDVTEGFEIAAKHSLELLKDLVIGKVGDLRDEESVGKVIRTAVNSKIFGEENHISDLVTKACIRALPESSHFNVDHIRVVKILGSGTNSSKLFNGMVFVREAQGVVKACSQAKVVVYSCPFDQLQTETKGTILINNAKELMDFSRGEETQMEDRVREISETGCKIIVTGGKVGELALHYANKYNLMVVKLTSKFDVRRVCKITGATPMPKFSTPTQEELGYIANVRTEEIGKTTAVLFDQDVNEGAISSIVVRGSMHDVMDEVERAIDDGVNTFKCLTRDPQYLAGAGATEIELANRLSDFANTQTGLVQYAIKQFVLAFESIVKVLCDNAGENATERIAELKADHREGKTTYGIVSTPEGRKVADAIEEQILDTYTAKYWGIRFAADTAITILRVDNIIMARSAGGPAARQPGKQDEDDD